MTTAVCTAQSGLTWDGGLFAIRDSRCYCNGVARMKGPTMRNVILAATLIVGFAKAELGAEGVKRPAAPTLLKSFSVPGRVGGVAFDSRGQTLASVGWETPAGTPGKKMRAGKMQAETQGTDRGDIRVWDVATGAELAHFGEDVGEMFDVVFSSDDRTIITAGRAANAPRKGEVRIWDAKTHKTIRSLGNPTNLVRCMACSPDGMLIACAGFDQAIHIFDAATGNELKVLVEPKMGPRSLTFGRDGKTLVCGYGQGTVTLWEVGTWEELNSFETKGLYLMSADLSPDGKRLAAAGADTKVLPGKGQGGHVYVWNLTTSLEERVIPLEQMVSDVAFSPDGEHFVTAGFVGMIWKTETGDQVATFERGSSTSSDKIRFSPDGKKIAISGLNNVTLWDVSGLVTK